MKAKISSVLRIHPVTVVAVLLFAAFFVWYNLQPHRFGGGSDGSRRYKHTFHGRPFQFAVQVSNVLPENVTTYKMHLPLLYNLLICACGMFNIAVVSECLMRRKQRTHSVLQFHLATLLVGVVACGLLLWLNMQPENVIVRNFDDGRVGLDIRGPGWPVYFLGATYTGPTESAALREYYTGFFRQESYWYKERLYMDIVTALILIGTVAFSCEWWLRRRDEKLITAAQRPAG